MAKITKEQIQKINSKCSNGWQLDIQYFLFHNEKTLYKRIEIDEENYLEFKLDYNYKNQIALYFNKFHHQKGDYFASSQGLGKKRILDTTEATRKNVNKLIEYTKTLNDEALIEINRNTEVTKSPMFVPSEAF